MMKHGANKRKYLEDMQAKERELIVPILEKARKILAKLTKEKGISVVIENTPMVLFASPEVDLTNDLIKAFESDK
jgi:outer membrane protein